MNNSWEQTLLIVTADHECGYLTGPKSGIFQSRPVWNPLAGRGIGKVPEMEWHSTKHTNALIPFYAKGAGSRRFWREAKNRDPVRNLYLDNTSIANVIFSLLGHQDYDENRDSTISVN
jgi:alkaline phosphatase